MNTLLITFTRKHPELDYSGLTETIKEYSHVRLSSTSYLIHSKESTKSIYRELRSFIHSDDTLFVFVLKKQWHGRGQNEVVDWVTSKL